MLYLHNIITLFALTLGLCFFATQAQATPISFAKLQQVPTQQNQLLESSNMTQHYFNATQSSRSKKNTSSKVTLSTETQELLVENELAPLVFILAIVGTFSYGVALLTAVMKSSHRWEKFARIVFLCGAISWGGLFGIMTVDMINQPSPELFRRTSAVGLMFAIQVILCVFAYTSKSSNPQKFSARLSPWMTPSGKSGLSGGFSFSGSF